MFGAGAGGHGRGRWRRLRGAATAPTDSNAGTSALVASRSPPRLNQPSLTPLLLALLQVRPREAALQPPGHLSG